MSKTIYYLGAEASYGRRGEDKKIIDGIPVVSYISKLVLTKRVIRTNILNQTGKVRLV